MSQINEPDHFVRMLRATIGKPLKFVDASNEYVTLFFEGATFQWYRRLAVVEQDRIQHVMGSMNADFAAQVSAACTADELIAKYRDVCGALLIAAREKHKSQPFGETDAVLSAQVEEWMRQQMEGAMLEMPVKSTRVN